MSDAPVLEVYRAPMRSRSDDVDHDAAVRWALGRGVVAVGGLLPVPPQGLEDAVDRLEHVGDARIARRLRRFADIEMSSFFWTPTEDDGQWCHASRFRIDDDRRPAPGTGAAGAGRRPRRARPRGPRTAGVRTVWSDRLEQLAHAPMPPSGRLVVLSAHPDDEVLAIGGWLASQTDREVVFVTATDGEASHPGSPTTTPDDLRAQRPAELVRALQSLGFVDPDVRRLERPDGGLADDPDGLVADLAPLVDGAALVLAPFEADGHRDHDALGAAALAAAGGDVPVWRFPIWTWAWISPGDQAWLDAAHRLPVSAEARERKARAVQDFASQVRPLGDDPADAAVVGGELLAHATSAPEVVVT